jgi:CheY-like chemotaxis protein
MKNLINMKISKSILLVEDDLDDQEFFIEALRDIQNATLYAVVSNGKEALDKLKNSEILPDLIFTDINMPVMNGIECLSELIKNPQTMNIPVFILSSSTPHREIACKLGAKAFIEKPGDTKMLRNQLELMINLDFVPDCDIANPTYGPMLSTF